MKLRNPDKKRRKSGNQQHCAWPAMTTENLLNAPQSPRAAPSAQQAVGRRVAAAKMQESKA